MAHVNTNHTQNGPQKSWQVETPSRVGKSRCSPCFLMFLSCIGEWLHDSRCFHLEGCHQIGKLLMCAPDMLPFQLGSGLTMTYNCSLQGGARLKRQNQYLEVVGSSSSVPPEEMVSMLVWIARALKPIAARGLAHWRRSRCIDGFLGHQMTNESESVKCSLGPLSQPNPLDSADPKSVKWPHWWRKASLTSSDRTQEQT